MDEGVRRVTKTRIAAGGGRGEEEDVLAVEEPLEIRVEGQSVAVVMRTPGNDEELVAGFLRTEGVVEDSRDVFEISPCPAAEGAGEGNVMEVLVRNPDEELLEKLTRHVFSASSCGICGKATIESVFVSFPQIESSLVVEPDVLLGLPDKLRNAQANFEQTGGLHASALFDGSGELLLLREDVGRHNALDKVIGSALLNQQLPLRDRILLVSGRISFELMQKALSGGIPIIAGISAPSSLAVDFANESGQTLVGFLRPGGFNVYANPERIRSGAA
ncbi:MAG: formate dehydrogenase accessory sulfurtransferase FdhD [Verrucomicrobiota bacterium]